MIEYLFEKKSWKKLLSLSPKKQIKKVNYLIKKQFTIWFSPLIFKYYDKKLSKETIDFEIDAVYLWVDGFDDEIFNKRQTCLQMEQGLRYQAVAKGRFFDNEELKYSLRSLSKHAPWVRNIFIVTDNQVPKWLKSHPKVKIVDHKDIIDEKYLPLFNASAIEFGLGNIPNLSEHFIFLNDDMMFARNVSKSFFFSRDGLPKKYMRPMSKPFEYKSNQNLYQKNYVNSAVAFEKVYNIKSNMKNSHSIMPYNKSSFAKILEIFAIECEKTLTSKFRKEHDIMRVIVDFYEIHILKAHVINIRKAPFTFAVTYNLGEERNISNQILKMRPYMICINDTEKATDKDRQNAKQLMEALYPDKSEFEK